MGKKPISPVDSLIQPIWDVTPYPIALIDFHRNPKMRKFVYINPAFTNVTGYSSFEVVGRAASLLNGPATTQAAVEHCEPFLSQGKPCTTAILHYRKDGSQYAAHMTIAPLVEPNGKADYLMVIETMLAPAEGTGQNPAVASGANIVPLHLPMPLKEFPTGELPVHLASRPELDEIQALWTKLRGDRPLPQRSDFDLRTVSRWASHLSIATVTPLGRYQFRLFGSELSRVYGQDLTGRFLDELTPRDIWAVVSQHYDKVVATLEPLFAPISIANGHWYSEVSRLLLPLAGKGDKSAVAFIMGIDYTRY